MKLPELGALKVVGARVDKLVFGYRVKLDPGFLSYLRERSRVAREHGRAEISWSTLLPLIGGEHPAPARGKFRKLGSVKAAWCDEEHVSRVERRRVLWGELRYSRQDNKFIITNEPAFIIVIDPYASGGDVGPKSETGAEPLRTNIDTRQGRQALAESADRGEPGYTVEVTVYATELATAGIESAQKEADQIAEMVGDVKEKCLRRVDLCADVAGMTIREDDVACLVKRPKCAWVQNFADGTWQNSRGERGGIGEDHGEHGASDVHGREAGGKTLVRASGPMRRIRPRKYVPPVAARAPVITGLSVGRGGAMMMRIYDKRAELARADDRAAERREIEETIWLRNGWADDGPLPKDAPVTRVEFQIRGEALRELGLRDPDCMQTVERDAEGNKVGHVAALVKDESTGRMRKARLTDWLDSVWMTCLGWCRLVVPEVTKSGRAVQPSRCAIDPRWELLRMVRFADRAPKILARYRARGAASAAQGLGVMISQAAREGQITERWEESPDWYERLCNPMTILENRIRVLIRDEESRILEELLEKHGDAIRANVHVAVRVNAARARFMREGRTVEPRKPRKTSADRYVACGEWSMPITIGQMTPDLAAAFGRRVA